MQKKVFFKNSKGLKLAGILHVPKNKKDIGIIIVPGFAGGKDRNVIPALATALEGNGFLTLRFDLAGSGDSEGKFEDGTITKHVEDVKAAIDFITPDVKKVCLICHSNGGCIAMLEYIKYRNFDKLVLISPAIKEIKKRFSDEDFKRLEKGDVLVYVNSLGERYPMKIGYYKDRDSYDFVEEAKKLDIPVLTIMGTKDTVADLEKTKKMHEVLKVSKQLEIIEGENHHFHDKSDKLTPIMLEFLQ